MTTAPVLALIGELEADLPSLLVNSVVDYAIFVLDPEGNVISWNPGAERIKGWRREEILGKHFSVFYTPDDIANGKPWRTLEQAVSAGRWADQGWRTRKDGSTFWADVVITALRDPDGVLVGFAKVTRDLSDGQKAADADRSLVALQERERIARELHHTVIRTLFGIGLSLQSAAVETTDDTLRARLEAAIDELDDAIRDVRAHIFSPEPSRPVPTPPKRRSSATAPRPRAHKPGRRLQRRGRTSRG